MSSTLKATRSGLSVRILIQIGLYHLNLRNIHHLITQVRLSLSITPEDPPTNPQTLNMRMFSEYPTPLTSHASPIRKEVKIMKTQPTPNFHINTNPPPWRSLMRFWLHYCSLWSASHWCTLKSIFFLTRLLELLGLDNQLTDFLHYHLSYLTLSLLQYSNYYKIILYKWK